MPRSPEPRPTSTRGEPKSNDMEPLELSSTKDAAGARQLEQEPARGHRLGTDDRSRPDHEIRAELAATFAQMDDIDTSRFEAIVANGHVTLIGVVPDYESKRHIETTCESIAGVRIVVDQLRVLPDEPYAGAGGLRTTDPEADRGRSR